MLIFAGCNGMSDDSVLTIDGEKITTEEYNVYLDEQIKSFEEQGGEDIWQVDFDGVSAVNVAKQNAVNSLVMVKAAAMHAEQLGVTLTEENKKEAAEKASQLIGYDQNKELLIKIMEEAALQSKVYEKITGSYQINDDEFELYLESYYEQNKDRYTKHTVKEIFVQSTDTRYSRDDIKKIFETIKTSADFDKAAAEISPDTPVVEQELDESLYSEEVLSQITSSQKGSYVLAEDTSGYHIFSIINITQTPVDSIREEVKAQYINEKRQEIYSAQNDSWTASMKVEKNNIVYDAIEINKAVQG